MSKAVYRAAAAGIAATALVAGPAGAQQAGRPGRATAAEVEELRAQLEALTARLDAQQAALNEALRQLSAAKAQADAAVTQVQAAQAEVPKQVETALAARKESKPEWYDRTRISGRMFFNLSSIDQDVNGVEPVGEPNGVTNGFGFNVKRFYLGVDHRFDDVFAANLTMDASNVVGRTSNGGFNAFSAPADAQLVGRGFYIKKAYLEAKLSPAFVVRAGAADMPWVPFVDNVYGFRHIENVLIDRIGYGTSADWGVHVSGQFAEGLVDYQVSAVNGSGYRNVRVTEAIDVEGRVALNYEGFVAGLGGYVGKLGAKGGSTTTYNSARRVNALVAYKGDRFTAGGEYYYTENWGAAFITTPQEDKGDGYSLFASFAATPRLSVFGRYDWAKPRDDTAPALEEEYFNVGVQFTPYLSTVLKENVDLALVYKRDVVEGGTLSTSNGTIGGSTRGTYDELGLFGQFRF